MAPRQARVQFPHDLRVMGSVMAVSDRHPYTVSYP